MIHAGRRTMRATAIFGFSVLGLVASPLPASAEPTLDQAQDKASHLRHQRQAAAESRSDNSGDLAAAQRRLREVDAEISDAQASLARLEAQTARTPGLEGLDQSEGLQAATAVLESPDPTSALETAVDDAQARALAPKAISALTARLDELEASRATRLAGVRHLTLAAVNFDKTVGALNGRAARAQTLVEQLEARAERAAAARPSRSGERVAAAPAAPAAPAPSGGAAAAVAYAMSQVGDAYVYGASGPDAFDCSGLTSMAWAQGGVALPHSSGAQMGSGMSVSSSALQPGDLVFYYSPVSHVGIYVGNGQLVHAANPGTGVQLTSAFSMPISGAVRPG